MISLLQHDKTDSQSFNQIAKNIFAPVYPVLAKQILSRSNIKEGICLDLGSGSAMLGMALSRETELLIYALDHSPEMLALAQGNIQENSLSRTVQPVLGDVHCLPWPEKSIDLVVSRGSIFFWDNLTKVYQEVKRVLKSGGFAYIGGGFGSQQLYEEIREKMKSYHDWEINVQKRMSKDNIDSMKKALTEAKIEKTEIKHDETGFWIILWQESSA